MDMDITPIDPTLHCLAFTDIIAKINLILFSEELNFLKK